MLNAANPEELVVISAVSPIEAKAVFSGIFRGTRAVNSSGDIKDAKYSRGGT